MKKKPHVLVVASALDIRRELTLSWKWWSLLKALWGEGAELTVIPFRGKSVETPWWRSQPRAELQAPFWRRYFTADTARRDNWASLLQRILKERPDTHAVLYLGLPLDFFGSIAREIKERTGLRQVYLDGEAAEYLGRVDADSTHMESFDHVLTTQPGHEKVYLGLGARKAHLFPWWSDPDFFRPVDAAGADFDLMAWGQGEEEARPEWAQSLLFGPLQKHAKWRPAGVGGGLVWPRELKPRLTHLEHPAAPDFGRFASGAYLHVSIVENLHHEIDGLALGRLVDLACMGACVVTHPFQGLEQMFKPGDEILVASGEDEATKLLSRARRIASWRGYLGAAARQRVVRHHSAQARAHTLMRML